MATTALKTATLSNGLRIAVVSDPQALTATAMVLVGVGSSYEVPRENGLSHFLEHMCFKGTTKRPSARVITEEIESLGAVTNAFTDREYTGYFIKGNPAHLPQFVDILNDIYTNATFPEKEIEKEKGVIVEEINMYEDMPQQKVGELLFSLLYPGHATGRSVLGTKETVASFTQKDFFSYKERFYTGVNTLIVFSGNVTFAKARALAERQFGLIKRAKKNTRVRVKQAQTAPQIAVQKKQTDQAHIILAFRSLPLGHRDLVAARLLATLLGRGMSSRLSLLVREELGAAYYVYAHQESYTDHGLFAIAAGLDKNRFLEVMRAIIGECVKLKNELVPPLELAKAKEYAIGTFRLGLELSDDIANFYGAQMVLHQKVRTPEALIAALKKVTARDLQRIARTLFSSKRANIALVGPFDQTDVPRDLFTPLS